MFRPRVIPVLLLKDLGLVKSTNFKNFRYIGDPINAVKIFNDLKADELVFLDILASKKKTTISLDFVRKVGDEANMPFAVGGGIRTIRHIKDILNSGAEKVVINTFAAENPDFIKQATNEFGSSTIVVSIDVKQNILRRENVYIYSGTKSSGLDPVKFAILMEDKGAGELIINSIEHDGIMKGYNIELTKRIASAVSIPVVAMGGAGKLSDINEVFTNGYASAAGVGSMFVYHGPRKAVLINYPTREDLKKLFQS